MPHDDGRSRQSVIPDYGRISTYRSPGGFAVRLDGGNGFGGAVITPYFDSLLVKMTTWGQTLEEAVRRTDRSLREFRIHGVKTNIAFFDNLILHPTFISGAATTEFVDSTPELFRFRVARDRDLHVLVEFSESKIRNTSMPWSALFLINARGDERHDESTLLELARGGAAPYSARRRTRSGRT